MVYQGGSTIELERLGFLFLISKPLLSEQNAFLSSKYYWFFNSAVFPNKCPSMSKSGCPMK